MAPQSVLITGCSSGIGLATAVMLAKDKQHQFKVYATMRNLKSKANLEKAAGDTLNKNLFIRELDVTKEATITSVVDEILRENGRIDVLVNNAGYTGLDGVDQKPMEFGLAMMDTNFWGPVRTMRAVLPAMKKQKSGRILNVSSMAAVHAVPFHAMYSATKFALEGFSEASSSVLKDVYNIRVLIVEPGPTNTEMIAKNMSLPPAEQAKDFEAPLKDAFLKSLEGMTDRLKNLVQQPEEVAQVIQEVILSENPHLRTQASDILKKEAAKKFLDPHTDGFMKEKWQKK
ncbi:retinol dehydrogenase 8-like [Patiria miniata]|uniref:Uncharacterized protein n=1 Tax=Patiria miniata TaxID=46514 RepID=A0A914BU49_PATMI|nr:retinol dehydrogenase 8-like [Patiria miniata]